MIARLGIKINVLKTTKCKLEADYDTLNGEMDRLIGALANIHSLSQVVLGFTVKEH